ncbi:MAG: restriction endonuclease subunit S [Bacillota bacterium]|nr:restriction endonuclease subunit S [Bacillota bacterium]
MSVSEWKRYTVQELVDLKMLDKPLDGNHGGIHPKTSDYVICGVPFIMANDLKNGKVDYGCCNFITEKQAKTLKKGFAKHGDVLLTHKATMGRTAIVDNSHPYIVLTPQVTYYRVLMGIYNKYLKYYFDSKDFQDILLNWSGSGSTRAYLGITGQRKLPIILPPLPEQKAIADTISCLDDKIELNNRINKTLEEMAKAIFKSWFVDFEPFQDGEFEDSELGRIPKGWRVGTISDLGSVIGGSTPSKACAEYYTDSGIAWITPKDLSNNKDKFISKGEIDITDLVLKNSSTKIMPKGTVLFSSRAPIGYIAIAKNNVTTNQGFKSVVPESNIGTEYVYCFLKSNVDVIENRATGSTFKEVSGSVMKQIPALIPSDSVLSKFQQIFNMYFEQQMQIECQNQTLIAIRDSLLPKLMSGEIRVPLEEVK